MAPPGAAALRAGAVVAALALDRRLGEPPPALHPVAGFGRAMTTLEGRLWADRRRRGILYAAVGVGVAAGVGAGISRGGPLRRFAAVAGAAYVAVAARALDEAAGAVDEALAAGDLELARRRVRSLVGRNPDGLDEEGLARAVIESVAENTVDAVVAPLVWAAAAGAPGVLAYRAVNTLDAMVGHRSLRYQRFGWAAARADDVANWLPARLAALVVAVSRPGRARAVVRAVRDQAPGHPSPNAGVVEAAFAAALGLTLGGINDYGGRIEHRPPLGEGRAPVRTDIDRACRLSRRTAGASAGLIAMLTAAVGGARARRAGRGARAW